ncbi:3-dehydroquinate synthase [Treponema pedis]|uniref:3-dehydroquinate synthase n=1 Tax=Treponema pedis str. T A4 TaxID=1291379 RepID=S5ZK80_9SPIR|nr:3-dehydroquinate synthase family protein [Treponema pedis]AGT42987.1 3-dehydroquinate synthase [Treponema pedis str. T A4]
MTDLFSFTTVQGTTNIFYCEEMELPILQSEDAVYIADTNTARFVKQAKNFSSNIPLIIIESGEENKNFTSLELILKTALDAGLSRNSIFIGIGGGVICDLTAFAASIYMRGVKCNLVPTTLLAMADASIGGKSAVNFLNYKNMIGSFFKADEIYIIPEFLKTLNDKEYFSGLAEIFKIALLYSPKLYQIFLEQSEKILNRNEELIFEILKRAIISKANVVTRDFYEKNERAYLNLGHTFAHALETVSDFKTVSHGEAVAWGISRALRLGENLGLTDCEYANEVCSIIKKFGWCTEAVPQCLVHLKNEFANKIIAAMKKDKKNMHGKIRVILQENIEENLIYEAEEKDIKAVLI